MKFRTRKGRIVYGGGGIIPDVFVPLEGKHGDEEVSLLMQSGIVSYFAFEQIDRERTQFKGLTPALLTDKITVSDKYYKAFIDYLAKNGLAFRLDRHKATVKHYLAAEFARQLLSDKAYYDMVLKEDNMVRAVLEAKESKNKTSGIN